MPLSGIEKGGRAVVERFNLPEALTRRLQILGLTLKTEVDVVGRKGRGVDILKWRGARFALGAPITQSIFVRRKP